MRVSPTRTFYLNTKALVYVSVFLKEWAPFQWVPLALAMFGIVFNAIPAMADKITVRGADIVYNDTLETMVASGNAELIHPQFKVFADRITYNKKTQLITGDNNIELIQQNQVILSDSFAYNAKTNEMAINQLLLELTTEKNQQFFAKANEFSDHGTVKKGKKGRLTTCSFDPPHYYLEADSFTIYPDRRIIGQNVTLVNPVLFLPLGFWSPAYIFELGKRKVIYLMPVMGTNIIEGGFLKNQIDYVLNDYWTGEGYIDVLSKKGLGMGTRLNYTNYDNMDGDLYYYGVSDTEYNTKEWNQTLKLSDENTLSTHIQSKNMYLINGGVARSDAHHIKFEKESIDATHKASYEFNQSHQSSIKPKTYRMNYSNRSDSNDSIELNINHSETAINSDSITVRNQSKIGYDVSNTNSVSYYQKEMAANDARKESYLKVNHGFSKTIDDVGRVNASFDYYFDTDNDTVTEDVRNHIVQKVPEIDLSLNQYKLNSEWHIRQTFQYGYYDEAYFISSLNKQRRFSGSRLSTTQSLNGNYEFDFLNGELGIDSSYTQYYYSTSDQTYTLGINSSYQTDAFSFLKTNTSHTRKWGPKQGNTPFYFDERDITEKNELTETITLYALSPEKYAFSYSTGYNWIVDYQLDNAFKLLIRPNHMFNAVFRTTYLLRQKRYSNLVSNFEYRPSKLFNTNIQANYDLNEGELISLNHMVSGSTSRQWENRWIFSAYFTYAPKYKQNYQLQTLTLTKDLHERKLTLMYNRVLEEFRFQFTINAFPENTFGFTNNKYESFRLEGVFDDESVQR